MGPATPKRGSERMEDRRKNVTNVRLKAYAPVSTNAVIRVSAFQRADIARNFSHFLQTGRQLNLARVWRRRGTMFLIAAALAAPAAYYFPMMERSAASLIGLGVFFTIVLCWLFGKGVDLLRRFVMQVSPPHAGLGATFTRDTAPIWAGHAAAVISHCAQESVVDKLAEFQSDVETPYRVIKGLAPLPFFFQRRPLGFETGKVSPADRYFIEDALFKTDALCGGVLHLLGARPGPRFDESGDDGGEDDPVAQDHYWRADVQEVPDSIQSDIFLRFHQSTIERAFTNTCRYKTYAAISNFRKTPVLILRVKDIVNCLRNEGGEHREHHALIYRGLREITPDNVLEALTSDAFERHPPRMERIAADDVDPKQGEVLREGEDDDWTMMFDPARVWVKEGASSHKYMEALLALRNAIHFVSRRRTIAVHLAKRDVLIVDNRRALVGRQEERPAVSIEDAIASMREPLEGRWLRQIYGFPSGNAPDNFTPIRRTASAEDPEEIFEQAQAYEAPAPGAPSAVPEHTGRALQ